MHRTRLSDLSTLSHAPAVQLLMRGRAAIVAAVVLVGVVVLIDVLDVRIRPQPTLPPATYALALLVAASFLAPTLVAAVAALSMVAQLLVAWHHQAPLSSVAFDQAILALVGVLAVLYSARTRAETALKAEREVALLKLQGVFEGMVEGVIIIDGSGRLVSINPAALRSFGMVDASDLIGAGWQDVAGEGAIELRHLDGRLLPVEEWPPARILRGETVADMEVVIRHLQTGGTWVACFNGKMAHSRSGATGVGVLTVRDVTADKKVEALRTSEERFRLIAENSPDTVFHQDRELRYSWVVNPAPPFSGEQVAGKTDFDLFPAEEAQQLLEMKRRVLETGAPHRAEICLTRGESHRCFDLIVEPWRDRDGAVVGLAGYGRDVTEQKRAQLQVLEQQRSMAAMQERERLARELHDSLAQVLSYVAAEAEAARRLISREETARAEEYLDLLCEAARDAVGQVRDFIGSMKTARAADLFETVAQQLQRLEAEGVRTEMSAPPCLSEDVLAEPVRFQLSRIIQEALANVRKHSAAGSVRVGFNPRGARLDVTIEDDGRGFDPSQSSDGEGQSFGLLVMRERAEEAGGTLRVLSAPGKGTRVVVQVPLMEVG